MEFTNVPAYNGVLTDSTHVDANVMGNIYKTLLMGRTADTVNLSPIQDVAKEWALARKKANEQGTTTIVLAGLFYDYSQIRSNALSMGDIAIQGNGYSDVYIGQQWQDPYETLHTMAFAPPVSRVDKLRFDVTLPKELFMSNRFANMTALEIDFKDGNGFSQVYEETVAVIYESNGIKEWDFRITMDNNQIFLARTQFVVDAPIIDTSQANYVTNVFIPGPGSESILAHQGANLRIDYAPDSFGKVMKPFIVAEGFDPGSILSPESAGGASTLDDFLDNVENSSFQLRSLLEFDNSQEYDIIYIDWQNGTNSVQHNSAVLRNVIEWVNNQKSVE